MADTPNVDKLNIDDFDEEDDDEFVDEGIENLPVATEADLLAAIADAQEVLTLFLENKNDEAVKKIESKGNKSIYHALGVGCIHFLKAIITFSPNDVKTAVESLKKSAAFCNRRRKKNSAMSKMVKKANYNSYAEEEIHAELCYAECVLLRAAITFLQDENIMSFVKGGLRFRKSYRAYRQCEAMLESRNFPNEQLKNHFKTGVDMGIGGFNLLLSALPKRILKLVEFVGFSGKRDIGHRRLEEGRLLRQYLRAPLCSLAILGYHGYISYIIGKGCADLSYPVRVLSDWRVDFPKSAVAIFADARLENLQGNLSKAIEILESTLKIHVDWKEFYHIPYIELAWSHALKGEYRKAVNYVDILLKESHWTKCVFTYVKAIGLTACSDITEDEKKEVIALMKSVPNLRRRFSGKSNPVEKFFCKKADRFLAQGNWLIVPSYESWYVANYLMLLKGKIPLLEPVLKEIESSIEHVKTQKDTKYFMDNYCLAVFLKGVVLRYMDKPAPAEECFKEVLQNHKKIKEDTYLISVANMELGFICMDRKDYSTATTYLKTAKKEKNFWAEFRIHQGREEIKALTKK